MKRIIEFVNSGHLKVSDEHFEDTVMDAINYYILLSALIKDRDADRDAVRPNFQ